MQKYYDPSLITPEPQLADSRRAYIHNIQKEEQFDADVAVIAPILQDRWTREILGPFGFPNNAEHVMIWKDYLKVYKPQVLDEAITLLVGRLKAHERRYGSVLPNIAAIMPTEEEMRKMSGDALKERVNRAGGVQNLRAFYRSLVQDLKREDDKQNPIKRRFHERIMIAVLEQAEGQDVFFSIPKADYEAAGLYLPADHHRLAVRVGWIVEDTSGYGAMGRIKGTEKWKLTEKGVLALECLRGGFAVPFAIAVG